MASIGDYWDDDTICHIAKLLQEYPNLFSTKFIEMKRILGNLGVMKNPLKEGAKPVKQCPYRLNIEYKEKVKPAKTLTNVTTRSLPLNFL